MNGARFEKAGDVFAGIREGVFGPRTTQMSDTPFLARN